MSQLSCNSIHSHVDSSIVMCRYLLESQTRNYIHDHAEYLRRTRNPKCTYNLNEDASVDSALIHMYSCPGNLKAWDFYKPNSKICTLQPDQPAAKINLIESSQVGAALRMTVQIPDCFEPYSKRFLLKLFQVLQYDVKIIDLCGNLRDPVLYELEFYRDQKLLYSGQFKVKWVIQSLNDHSLSSIEIR